MAHPSTEMTAMRQVFICDAIRTKGLQSTGEITACLKAGGNCGSCVPELKRLLVEARVQQAA